MPREDLVAALSMGSAPQQAMDGRWQRLMQELLAEEEQKQAAFDPYQFGAGGQEMPLAQGVTDPNAKFQGGGASGSWAPEAEPPSTLGEWWDQSTAFRPMAEEAYSAATLPGDVYAGKVDPASDEAIERSFDLAGSLTLGAGAVPAKGMELRAGLGMPGRSYAATPLRGLDDADHPAMVSPSVTSTKARLVDSDEEFVPTGLETMRQDPDKFKSNMELMRNPKNYPGMRPDMVKGDPDSIAKHATDQIMSNLGFFIGKAQPEDWAGLSWYESAHKLARIWADEHGINDASAVGAIAALSPQADWNINVHLAKQLIDRFQNKGSLSWDPAMGDVGKMLISREAEKNIKAIFAGKQGVATTAPIIERIRGKPMGELTNPIDIGMFARIHEEAFGDPLQGGRRGFRLFNPDGTFGDFKKTKAGQLSKPSWNSGSMVGNAVRALMGDGDARQISKGLGGAHKVRSFYNNILHPWSKRRDVTMDSHAIEAAWMGLFPAAKNHGLATGTANSNPFGSFGTYGLYADGYRKVADDLSRIKKREIRPNQLQSVIWEMKRKLFEGVDKNPAAVEKITKTWQDYQSNKITLRQAQSDVWDIAEEVSGNARAAASQR